MPAIELSPLDRTTLLTIGNTDATIGIDHAAGFIRSLRWNATGIDLFQQLLKSGKYPPTVGGLRSYDERDERWYSDVNAPFTITGMRQEGQSVRFNKRFTGAPFSLDVELRCDDDALHWELQATKADATVADRSLRAVFFLPLLAGWDVWAPGVAG